MKKNGIFSAKSFLTLVSVLSILLMFSLVCAGVLFVLNRMDLVYFPFETDEQEKTLESDASVLLSLSAESKVYAVTAPTGIAAYEALVKEAPFSDSFYLKIRVRHEKEGQPYSGVYEIWRFGEKYRINRYNEQDEVEYMVTCDGERVQLVDFGTLSASYYMMSDGFFFEEIAPLPDFSSFFTDQYEIFEYSETDTLCIAVCDYPTRNTVDETKLYKETGLPASYKRITNGETVLTIETLSVNSAFGFSERMFEID